jgi:phosphate transport system protein
MNWRKTPGQALEAQIVSVTTAHSSRQAIDRIDEILIQMFALVGEAIAGATQSLLAGDRATAKLIIERDEVVDELARSAIVAISHELVEGDHGPQQRRELVALLRLVPEIERNGDLAEHIARQAVRTVNTEFTPRIRGLIERMGEVCASIWMHTGNIIADRSTSEASAIEDLDDEIDEIHVSLVAELTSKKISRMVAIELSLIARFYERFGDHAVNLARWLKTMDGSLVEPPSSGAD